MSNVDWAGLPYKVFFFTPESPLHLQGWLERMYIEERLVLVAVSGECYFIFKPISDGAG